MININFLVGMPRAGNTILSSILNQNPNITFTANSPLTEIIYQLDLIKITDKTSLNFPDNISFDNLITKSFYTYSETYKTPYVINRSNWATSGNLKLLEKYFDKEIKFLIEGHNLWSVLLPFSRPDIISKTDNYGHTNPALIRLAFDRQYETGVFLSEIL